MQNNLLVYVWAAAAGIFWGIWPICYNTSEIKGNAGVMMLNFLIFILIGSLSLFSDTSSLPEIKWWLAPGVTVAVLGFFAFILYSYTVPFSNVKWLYLFAAGIFAALGILCFGQVTNLVIPSGLAPFFTIMLIGQQFVSTAHNAYANREIRWSNIMVLLAVSAAIIYVNNNTKPITQ